MNDRSTAKQALWSPASHEDAARTPVVVRERVLARRASFTYPPTRRTRHIVIERPHAHAHSSRSRYMWFTGLYMASIALFGAFVSAERALLALI
jgi:hypothetical protein